MQLFVAALVFFLVLAYLAPAAFVAFGKMIDAPRCAIGMTQYCDRSYDAVERLFGN
jgi:hypothetical protein